MARISTSGKQWGGECNCFSQGEGLPHFLTDRLPISNPPRPMMLPRNKNLRPQRLSLSPNTASEGLSTTDPYQYLWKAQEIKIIKKRRKALDNTGNNFTDITLFFQAQPLLFLKLTLLPNPCSPIISFLFHVFLCSLFLAISY